MFVEGITQTNLKIYASIILAEVIFGVWPLVASQAIKEGFDPIVFVLYRCAGASVLLTGASWIIEKPLSHVPKKLLNQLPINLTEAVALPWVHFLALGLLLSLNFLGYIYGVAFTSSTQAALMQPCIPVVACLVGMTARTESVGVSKFLGILLSVSGAMFLVYVGQEEADYRGKKAGHRYQLGTLALTVNVIATAFYFVLQKEIIRKGHPPIFVTGVSTTVATCFVTLLTLFYAEEWKLSSWSPWILTPRREAALAYAIIFTSTLNFIILSWANKVTSASTVTAFSTLQPLITSAIAVFFLGVYPNQHMILGGTAIIGGLILTVRSQLYDFPQSTESACLIRSGASSSERRLL